MFEFFADVLREHGAVAFLLIVVCILFYRLIWKVWNAAMMGKDEEIRRLAEERDRYQKLVFERLLTSDPQKMPADSGDKGSGEARIQ